jgi:hypothetical protein
MGQDHGIEVTTRRLGDNDRRHRSQLVQ